MARMVQSLSNPETNHCHLLILLSGNGTNLQVIIDQLKLIAPSAALSVSNARGAGGMLAERQI